MKGRSIWLTEKEILWLQEAIHDMLDNYNDQGFTEEEKDRFYEKVKGL